MTGRIDLSKWHTQCWGLDNQIHNIRLREKMQENEDWLWHQAHAAEIARMIQNLMGMAEEHLFKMGNIEENCDKFQQRKQL